MMAFWAAVNSPVRRDGDSYEASLDLLRRGGGSVEGQERAETAFEWLARSRDWRAIKSIYRGIQRARRRRCRVRDHANAKQWHHAGGGETPL